MAKLYFRYGAMNSGKSTLLLQTAYNYQEKGMNVIIMKPKKDKKADECISSRLGIEKKVDYLLDENDSVLEMIKNNIGIACILVDEAQFLTPLQVEELLRVTTDYDIPVICYGIRTDFKTNGFPGSSRLLELAHSIEEMKTICECGSKATFNARFIDDKLVIDGEQVAIDGFNNVTYKSMCPKCYYRLSDNIKKLKKVKENNNE